MNPVRRIVRPAANATSAYVPKSTSIRQPVSSGLSAWARSWKRTSRIATPVKPNSDTAATTRTALNDGDRSSRTSSIGALVRNSTSTNATSATAETTQVVATTGLV